MITKSLRLNLKLVYQRTHRMMTCPSKCRPLNSASTGMNRCILSSFPIAACLHQNLRHLASSANFDVRPYDSCLPAVGVAAYQLRRSIRFISGSPVRLAVATSEVIFPNNCGFLKSTVEFGAEKPKLWNGFWKS
jgi:hypothetical protein